MMQRGRPGLRGAGVEGSGKDAGAAGRAHPPLEVPSRARGGGPFLMGFEPCDGEVVGVEERGDVSPERRELGLGGRLAVEVAQGDDADVVLVAVLDVSTLEFEGSCLPDVAGSIDGKVIADVAPALAAMGLTDGVQASGGGMGVVAVEGAHPIVVYGDVAYGEHGLHQCGHGSAGCPGGSGEDAGERGPRWGWGVDEGRLDGFRRRDVGKGACIPGGSGQVPDGALGVGATGE